MGHLPLTKSMFPPLVGNGSPGSAKHHPPFPTHEVVSPFGRESSYFMRNCRICIDSSSDEKFIIAYIAFYQESVWMNEAELSFLRRLEHNY